MQLHNRGSRPIVSVRKCGECLMQVCRLGVNCEIENRFGSAMLGRQVAQRASPGMPVACLGCDSGRSGKGGRSPVAVRGVEV